MRWQCPYYPDVSLWDGAQGQDMPKYEALHMAKYGKKVLLERIVRLVLSINLKRSSWLQTYVDATSRLEGELPLCEDARNKLAKLEDCHKTAQPPLHRLASGVT